MGGALIDGWLKQGLLSVDQLAILDPKPGESAQKAIQDGALHIHQAQDIPASVTTILLAIKPQMVGDFAASAAQHMPPKARLISILAGTSIANLQKLFGDRSIIRAMPNTPAAIGAGITAITGAATATQKDFEIAINLLSAAGPVHPVETEDLIDVVTAISGSGPAYVFHFCEALETAALELGLSDKLAADFARQTIIGAAALLEQSHQAPSKLRENVTSPNGTTQAALDVLMPEGGMTNLIGKAAKAAYKRAQELAGD